jgi:DNA-binding transcriptional regulator YiaG
MQVIASWTGSHADALRQSLRMTNESFAEYLDVAVRTVANWRKRPEVAIQQASGLDVASGRGGVMRRVRVRAGAMRGR